MKNIFLYFTFCFIFMNSQILLPQEVVQVQGDSLVFQGYEFRVKGMNYAFKDANWPLSDASGMWQKYWSICDSIDFELSLAESLGVNTVRFFIHYKSLGGGQIADSTISKIKHFINLCHSHRMKGLPTFFDFDYVDENAYTYPPSDSNDIKTYLHKIIDAFDNAEDRAKILAYDIKNEMDADAVFFEYSDIKCWASWIASKIRYWETVDHLLTIGLKDYNSFDNDVNDIIDIVSFHWFDDDFKKINNAFSTLKTLSDKPILVEEFGKETDTVKSMNKKEAISLLLLLDRN